MSRDRQAGPAPSALRVAVPVPLPQLFDYLPPRSGPAPVVGGRVLVPFGRRRLVGVVVETGARPRVDPERLVSATRVLDGGEAVLDASTLALLSWCWRYTKHPPGQVVEAALPVVLRRADGQLPPPPLAWSMTDGGRARHAEGAGRAPVQWRVLARLADGPVPESALAEGIKDWPRVRRALLAADWVATSEWQPAPVTPSPGHELLPGQRSAVEAVVGSLGAFEAHLVDGVTGSGKTEVYLEALARVLTEGGQALVLVPEIGLTPQLLRRFERRLGVRPHVSHSGCSDGERLETFAAARDGRARLVVGTRSALFLPMPDLRLLILDEEHDPSFRQEDGFRYSARDVAVKRAADLGIPVVLGSATPSLESLRNAVEGRYRHHRLTERATGAEMPAWQMLDLRQRGVTAGLAEDTVGAIAETLARDEQVLVFLNRRGFAPVLLCHDCGWHGTCERCDAHLTWHRRPSVLTCHHCGAQRRVPTLCPDCGADALQGAGEGTEQLERFLAGRFPKVPLWRIDRDSMRGRDAFEALSESVRAAGAGLLVGTQMLAKGHHFPNVTLAVVVDLDQALFSGDFRAMERMAQLLIQVAGRAGRADRPGRVLMQTHHPDDERLAGLVSEGYARFALAQLAERESAGLPPFGYLALLRAEARHRDDVMAFLEAAVEVLPEGPAELAGPLPALMERRGGRVRWYLMLRSDQRSTLHGQVDRWLPRVRALDAARRVRWAVDVDPANF